MSTISLTKLYSMLSAKLGKESAETLTSYIEDKTKLLATKADLSVLREDLSVLKGELRTEIASNKSEIIKWMFIFWIGQMVATFGFILLFLTK